MKTTVFSLLLLLLFNMNIAASERKALFNHGWKFHRGIVANAEQPEFNDSRWRVLNLPHDWSVEPAPMQREGITIGPFSKMTEGGAGGADTGQTLGGEGWYRKEFTVEERDKDKLLSLYFEGVYNQSEVWINGRKVYYNPYGYTSYRVDITPYCNPVGETNVIAVKVVNAGENSRWYAGSGIYRHVWLITTERVHLDEWDTFIDASKLESRGATVDFSTVIHNKTGTELPVDLNIEVFSPDGMLVHSDAYRQKVSDQQPFSTSFTIKNPRAWSIESPVLYHAQVIVSDGENIYDKISIPFGIRTIEASADKGFLLNGMPVKLKGACIHHDNGLLGAAAIDRAEERKVELLKANGYNAVRCAHNQVSEHFLDACDRLGLLVIHETFDQWQQAKRNDDYHQFFDEWSESDLIASLRRDRNHPSIIMWSIGNEIAQRADSIGEVIAKGLVDIIHRYDTSRFTTVGANDFWDRRHMGFEWDKDIHRAFRNVDIAGYNYMWWKYEGDIAANPERIIYGSESYPKDAALNWNLVEKHPAIIGDFVWTGIDYLGEAGLAHVLELAEGEHNPQFMGWPWYNAWCGDIDICGDKKPQSYYRDIVWREREISMAVRPPVAPGKKEVVNGWGWTDELLSWNWKGWEGEPMRVNVYSRSPKVRLYLDNELIDEKHTGPENYTATFHVPYRAGTIRAVNLDQGQESASVEFKTTGEPAAVRLVADRNRIDAHPNDLAYVHIEIVDAEGQVVPDANLPVKIEMEGAGTVIASGNAAPDDMQSFRSLMPNTFRGKALAILQPDGKEGKMQLTVSSDGLTADHVTIEVVD